MNAEEFKAAARAGGAIGLDGRPPSDEEIRTFMLGRARRRLAEAHADWCDALAEWDAALERWTPGQAAPAAVATIRGQR